MKKIRFLSLYLTFLILASLNLALSQDRKTADAFFESGDFESAYEAYSELIETESDTDVLKYRISVCVLNLYLPKKEAIKYLEEIISNQNHDANARFLLARAYQFDGNFEEAINHFTEFDRAGKGSEENLAVTGKFIDHCKNAVELKKFPVQTTFENLGPLVNSPFADYFPFAASDESFLFFTSRRNNGGEKRLNGTYYSDIFVTQSKNGKFTKAKSVNKKILSKNDDDEMVGLSSSGTKGVIYQEDESGAGKLVLVDVRNGDIYNPMKLPDVINTKFHEISASINNENKEIYFASDKAGGYGGTDLYVTRLLPNGEWGEPQNLGPTINTPYDEDFPVLSNDGKILYFSSNGHTGMGGYDIFKADYDKEKMRYVNPRNLGYPINSPYDEMNFSISESGRYGYISTYRPEGLGDLDIYRITFDDIEPDYTVFHGKIILPEDEQLETISMIVADETTGELFGEYLPNLSSMRYVIILPPGKYLLTIEAENFQFYEEKIEVLDKDAFVYEVIKDIDLKK